MIQHDLLTVQDGQAQYSIEVPEDISIFSVEKVFNLLKRDYNATFIGYVEPTVPAKVTLNPDLTDNIHARYKLFYIAQQRINQFDWAALASD